MTGNVISSIITNDTEQWKKWIIMVSSNKFEKGKQMIMMTVSLLLSVQQSKREYIVNYIQVLPWPLPWPHPWH